MNGHTYSMSRYNGSFRGMKQDVLEGGIRVPAIIRWPDGLSQYSEVNEMIHFWPAFVFIAIMAAAALWLRLRTGAIVPSIALHFGYNLVLVGIVLLATH